MIGVDEVGRGCIAGDLVVCAARFLSRNVERELREAGCELLDSKAFSSRARREKAFALLTGHKGVRFAVARMSPIDIERDGIHFAVLNAMRDATNTLIETSGAAAEILFDGRFVPVEFKQAGGRAVIKGDAKIPEISAASIIAKVTRDRELVELAVEYPDYGFEKHSGYGTARHIDAIGVHGLTPHHRSWARKFLKNV